MINSVIENDNKLKSKIKLDNIIDEMYLLPKWEKIKSFNITETFCIFWKKAVNLGLFRKFSSKNSIEKYSIRTEDGKDMASMDLKVYKDSVYIINIDINSKFNFDKIAKKMLQVAVEKALYNTTEKEVVANIPSSLLFNHKIKRCLLNNEFYAEEAQSDYEKDLFGETYTLKIGNKSKWMRRIKRFQFLINK